MEAVVHCFHFWSDWTDINPIEIDLDEWNWFELQYRCDRWFIIGSKYDKKREKWENKDLSDHGVVGIKELANFVKVASEKINKFSTNNYKPNLAEKIVEIYKMVE